jgi:enterochelin esterase-like enzyme
VASRRREVEDLVCTFRVSGRQPEFWDAVTGDISKVAAFEEVGGRTRVPLRLERAGSMFVVFRSAAPARRVQEIAKDSTPLVTTRPFAAPAAGLYRNVANNFTISAWLKPDYEAVPPVRATLAEPLRTGPVDACPLTYVVYPPAGEIVYGANHAACGFGAARDGVVVFERSSDAPQMVATARVPLAGWTHVAVVYRDGAPALYVDGKLVGEAAKSGKTVHPGLRESFGSPYCFLGQATDPQLINEALTEARIQQLIAGLPAPEEPPAFEFAGQARPELHFWQDGNYALKDSSGRSSTIAVSGIGKPIDITGPWNVKFQEGRGAPPEITLPELKSLHRHEQPGVKYFSGNATYIKKFNVPAGAMANGKRLYLDLGRVEVVADVKVVGDERDYYVYTPPGYDAKRKEPYPVIYLLHGLTEEASAWFTVGKANVIIDNYISQGKIKPVVMVAPLGYGVTADINRLYNDKPIQLEHLAKYTATLLNEVMPRIEADFNVSKRQQDHAIAGLSMGGAQTMSIGLGNPDRFAYVGGFSPALVMLDTDMAKAYPALSPKMNNQCKLVYFSCGTEDGLINSSIALKTYLEGKGVNEEFVRMPGAHVWPVFRRSFANFSLRLFK